MKNRYIGIYKIVADLRVVLILLIVILFFCFVDPTFRSLENLSNILTQISVLGVMAIGMTIVMISGGLDLSIGSVMALSGVIAAKLEIFSAGIAIPCAILSGLLVGLLNGVVIVKGKINFFITTLATMSIVRGIVLGCSNQRPVESYNIILNWIGNEEIGFIPISGILFIGILVIFSFILKGRTFGRDLYATGGNEDVARISGVHTDIIKILAFAICGTTAAIAGIIQTGRLGGALPMAGEYSLLTVIAAVVLGGTRLGGGYGNMFMTLQGVLVIGIMENGLSLHGVPAYYQMLIKGSILILVVLIDSYYWRVQQHKKILEEFK